MRHGPQLSHFHHFPQQRVEQAHDTQQRPRHRAPLERAADRCFHRGVTFRSRRGVAGKMQPRKGRKRVPLFSGPHKAWTKSGIKAKACGASMGLAS